MSTTAHHALPRIAGARVIFTLLGLAAMASVLLGTCSNRVMPKTPSGMRGLLVAPAHGADARLAVIRQLEQLGLDPQVQSAPGGIHNIVARKYGSASDRALRPALLISAGGMHAAAIGSALRGAAPLAYDLILLFADGQAGSAAFARYHPWARETGVVLRFAGGGRQLLLTHVRGSDAVELQDWMQRTSSSLGSSALHALSAPPADSLAAVREASLTFSGAASPDNPQAARAILALARHFADTPHDAGGTGPRVHF